MQQAWYSNVYRRNVVDMHISDVDERFMGQFDAARYVDLLVRAQVQSGRRDGLDHAVRGSHDRDRSLACREARDAVTPVLVNVRLWRQGLYRLLVRPGCAATTATAEGS